MKVSNLRFNTNKGIWLIKIKKISLLSLSNILMLFGQLLIAFFTYKAFELNSELSNRNAINMKQDYINNIYSSQDKIVKHKIALAKNLNNFEILVSKIEKEFHNLRYKNPNIFTYKNGKLLFNDFYKEKQNGFDNLKKLYKIEFQISKNIHNIEMVYSYILSNELYKKYDEDREMMLSFHRFLKNKIDTFDYINNIEKKIKNVLYKGEFKEFMSIVNDFPIGLMYDSSDFLSFIQNNIDKEDFYTVQDELNKAFQNTDDLKDIQYDNKINNRSDFRYYGKILD